MDHTFVDDKSLKNLEDYAVLVGSAILTLKTLHNMQLKGVEIGIMPKDMMEQAVYIMWSIKELIKRHENQLVSALELIGDDFDHDSVIARLKDKELVRARAMIRKPKEKMLEKVQE